MPPRPRLGPDESTNGQRALWVFLIATLVAPMIAAVFIFLASMASGLFGFGPPSLQGLAPDRLAAIAAERAMSSYLWSAMPSAIAGAALAAMVAWRGTFGWLEAAVAGVAAFAAMAVIGGGQLTTHLTPLAFLAGLIAVMMRAVLARARILKD